MIRNCRSIMMSSLRKFSPNSKKRFPQFVQLLLCTKIIQHKYVMCIEGDDLCLIIACGAYVTDNCSLSVSVFCCVHHPPAVLEAQMIGFHSKIPVHCCFINNGILHKHCTGYFRSCESFYFRFKFCDITV